MGSKPTAVNGWFYEMAGVAPHKRQCELASFAPARNSVKPPLRQAAETLPTSDRQHSETPKQNSKKEKKYKQ
jgi:hypothetical protein